MASTEVKITLRLPPELHAAVQAAAEQAERSLNSQIVWALRQATSTPRPPWGQP